MGKKMCVCVCVCVCVQKVNECWLVLKWDESKRDNEWMVAIIEEVKMFFLSSVDYQESWEKMRRIT